jgi:hypothetical protein
MITWRKGRYGYWGAYKVNDITKVEDKLIVPSVTAVVNSKDDPELDNWIETVGKEKAEMIMRLAGNRGTVMHMYMENFYAAWSKEGSHEKSMLYTQKKTNKQLKEDRPDIANKQIQTGRSLFYELLEEFGFVTEVHKVLGLENKIVNFTIPYRGAYDINYLHKDHKSGKLKNVITDYKSASSFIKNDSVKERKYKLQLSGYWEAYEKMFNKELDSAKIWVSIKNGGTQEIQINKEEKTDLFAEFTELCEHFHKENNQTFDMFKCDYRVDYTQYSEQPK